MKNNALESIGNYTSLMIRATVWPKKKRMFLRQLVREIYKLGVDSVWIVMIISIFMGIVITIQLAINIVTPLIPRFTLGFATREVILLEFSSTVMCLILAGKVGSSIASELGTMRVTEQIDAMEIMGVNSANYLIMPKVLGFMLFMPVLSIISMFLGIAGGYVACGFIPDLPQSDFLFGLQFYFNPIYILYSIIKSVVYAIIISSVASYFGYTVSGGALDVGKASTNAVVSTSVLILFFDVLLTNILLT